jgi:hypothetical protein
VANITRLYEQGADDERIGIYRRHWYRWLHAGVTLKLYLRLIHLSVSSACHPKSLYVYTHRPRFPGFPVSSSDDKVTLLLFFSLHVTK